jgi:DNA helicase HerA-like ATPase
MTDFTEAIAGAYEVEGPAIALGKGVHDGTLDPGAIVQAPLAMINRHGLIAGATGTGKTKTAQGIAEQLSAAGVPVLMADVKGDLSGLGAPGEPGGAAEKRATQLGDAFAPSAFPVEYLSIGGIGPGVPVRATVSDFGPQLLGKILGANETQEQSLQLVFHYADTKGLPLLDLADLRALLTYLDSDAGKPELEGIGGLSSATVGVLLRALVGVETGGGTEFFGEPQLDIADLMRLDADGRGVISLVELPAVQDKPLLWSTALMWLVAELFETLPEAGDLPKPKLVVFLDEAHLLFHDATGAFVSSIEQTVRLIRSKGVGVFFITQTPKDVPSSVLAQLGNRVQHALRAFTPEDAKALKATVSTFPTSKFYDLEELLPQLGIGEAVVTILDDNGVPTPVVHARLPAPRSRMAPADDVDGTAKASPLYPKYGTRVDAQSAREILAARLEQAAPQAPAPKPPPAPKAPRAPKPPRAPESPTEQLADFLGSRQGKALQKQVMRGVFGMLKKRL